MTRVSVPDGTPVSFRLLSGVNTEDNHAGAVIDMQTIGDVVVDSWVVVPDASKGQCEVSRVVQAGGHGHAGTIELTCSYIVSAVAGA